MTPSLLPYSNKNMLLVSKGKTHRWKEHLEKLYKTNIDGGKLRDTIIKSEFKVGSKKIIKHTEHMEFKTTF